ncbi:unnamed protein product, partial [Rotaria magnacalcarata]
MSLFLRPLIDELLNLERGEHFDFHDQDNNAITARVFLIGACCDKPAQAFLQFLPEPTAAFGCGRCEVKGFMDVLKKKYYDHLIKLVVMMHLCESRKVHHSYINIINRLGQSFVIDFPTLYSKRHCLQVVHSIIHISDTVRDFGPLQSFSTFQFENELGLLMRTNKSTRRRAQEMINNLRMMQEAHYHLHNMSTFNIDFSSYLSSRFINRYSIRGQQKGQARHPSKNPDELVRVFFPHSKINFYQTLHIGKLRLCTRSYATNKIADDSNITFLPDGIEYSSRIRAIFTLDNDEPYLLVAYLRDLNPLTCAINVNENFAYPNILYTSTSKWNFTPIEVKDFIEKSTFFRSTA